MSLERIVGFTLVSAFLLAGGGCYVLISEVDSLRCERVRGVCTVQRIGVVRKSVESFKLADLVGAKLGGAGGKLGTSKGKRVVFITTDGEVPLMGYATDLAKGEMEEQVAAVEEFVRTPTMPRLELSRDNRLSSSIIALVPIAIGAFLLIRVIQVSVIQAGRSKTEAQ